MDEKYELSDGVTYEYLDSEVAKKFYKQQKSYDSLIRLQPYNVVMPPCYLPFEKRIRDFKCFDDDVWIGSFPKCGTTWTIEMVWCILNNLDFATSKSVSVIKRGPFLDLTAIFDPKVTALFPESVTTVSNLKRPRLIKTHLSVDMLPRDLFKSKSKFVYVTRNPRDVIASYFNHFQILHAYSGSFEDFFDAFLEDLTGYYSPFYENVLGFWELSKVKDSNVCFITYEDMKADHAKVIRHVSEFLGKPLDEDKVQALVDHLKFSNMKKTDTLNFSDFTSVCKKELQTDVEDMSAFMRKGESGNWKKELTPEMIRRLNEWEAEALKGSDFNLYSKN